NTNLLTTSRSPRSTVPRGAPHGTIIGRICSGADYCRQLHDQAFLVYAEAKDLITSETDDTQPAPELIQDDDTEPDHPDDEDATGPDEEKMHRVERGNDTPTIGDGRFAFDPWTLVVDDDAFIWPSDIDPDTWDEFRPNDSTVKRPFTDISPVEIANATG